MELNSQSIIGIVGSGAMGAGIAQVAAISGHKVVVFDNNAASLEKARQSIALSFSKLVEKQKVTAEEAHAVVSRISFAENVAHLHGCNLIIEAIVENLEIKKQVF